MTNSFVIRLIRRGAALAAVSFAAAIAGCGHSAPPAETAKTAAPESEASATAQPAASTAAAAPAPATQALATEAAVKADPRQEFLARDRELYDKAVKLQNDEKFDEAGKAFEAIVQLNAQFCGDKHYRTRFARNRLRENQWMATLSADDRKKLRDSRQLGETSMEDRAQGRPAAAVDHTRQSAQILTALGGKQTVAFGKLCELNGVASADLGDMASADRALRAAIDAYGKTVGHPSLEEASALAAMSEMYAMHGEIEPSLQCIMQSVNAEADCRVAGMPDAMASYLLCKLGRRYRDLGEYLLAEQVFQQSANVARLANGIRSNEYVGCTQDLAAAYLYDGKLRETESLELEVLELIGQGAASGSGTMEILARGLLGCAYVQQGKFDIANPVLLRTLDLARNTLDDHSPYVGLLEGGVAELYIAQKQYQKAEPLLAHAMSLAEPKNEQYKPWCVRLMNDQIAMLHGLGRDAEATKIQARKDAMESGRVALCGKLRNDNMLPKTAGDAAAQMASRPTATPR